MLVRGVKEVVFHVFEGRMTDHLFHQPTAKTLALVVRVNNDIEDDRPIDVICEDPGACDESVPFPCSNEQLRIMDCLR